MVEGYRSMQRYRDRVVMIERMTSIRQIVKDRCISKDRLVMYSMKISIVERGIYVEVEIDNE